MPGLHYNSNIAEPIKAISPMLHWALGRHLSVLFRHCRTIYEIQTEWINLLKGKRIKISDRSAAKLTKAMARLDTPCNKMSQTGREHTVMRTREQGRKRGCENVAELDSSGRRGAFDKGEQKTVQKIQDGRTRVCVSLCRNNVEGVHRQ